jgi:hypothetical protein
MLYTIYPAHLCYTKFLFITQLPFDSKATQLNMNDSGNRGKAFVAFEKKPSKVKIPGGFTLNENGWIV